MNGSIQYREAWLSLGGNLGNVEEHFTYALKRISKHRKCQILAISSLYRTPAWGRTEQPDFLNACIKIKTRLSPHQLLHFCLKIERERRRLRKEKWGPRSLDIDILIYEGFENNSKDSKLILPHPFMVHRAFVIIPLAEISPNMAFEGKTLKKRAEEMMPQNRAIKKLTFGKY